MEYWLHRNMSWRWRFLDSYVNMPAGRHRELPVPASGPQLTELLFFKKGGHEVIGCGGVCLKGAHKSPLPQGKKKKKTLQLLYVFGWWCWWGVRGRWGQGVDSEDTMSCKTHALNIRAIKLVKLKAILENRKYLCVWLIIESCTRRLHR